MSGRPAFALATLFLTAALGACLSADEGGLDLAAIYGDKVSGENGTKAITAPVLAKIAGGSSADFQNLVTATFTIPKATITKTGTSLGGGQKVPVTFPKPNVTAEFLLPSSDKLGGFEARWAIRTIRPGAAANEFRDEGIAWGNAVPADKPYTASFADIGGFYVSAQLLSGGAHVATFVAPAIVSMVVTYSADSSVYPLRARSAPPPQNFNEMADEFEVNLRSFAAAIHAKTTDRPGSQGQVGTDVDLEVQGPDGRPAMDLKFGKACSGIGGAGSQVPSKDEAKEEVTGVGINQGVSKVRVGAMSNGCGSDTWYHNAGPVPYSVTFEVIFGPPMGGLTKSTGAAMPVPTTRAP